VSADPDIGLDLFRLEDQMSDTDMIVDDLIAPLPGGNSLRSCFSVPSPGLNIFSPFR